MPKCYLCSTNVNKGIVLHKYPKNVEICQAWMKFCNLIENVDDVASLRLCSQHFEDKDYLGYPVTFQKRKLQPCAIPSIKSLKRLSLKEIPASLNISEHATSLLQKDAPERRLINEKQQTDTNNDLIEEHSISLSQDDTHKKRLIDENQQTDINNDLTEEQAISLPSQEDSRKRRLIDDSQQTDINNDCEENVTGTSKRRRFYEPRYINEINLEDFSSPRGSRTLQLLKNKYSKTTKDLDCWKKKMSRLKKKIQMLEGMISHLKEKNLIENSSADNILNIMPSSIKKVMERKLHKGGKYSPELRNFALTLHFYSPKAYNYIRKTFEKLLPHPMTLREWYKVIDSFPGFTKEAFTAIALKAKKKTIIANLIFDEMSIRKQLIYSNGSFEGTVDLGTSELSDKDNLPMASSALVLMIVLLNAGKFQ